LVVDHIIYTPETTNNWTRAHSETQKERPWAYPRLIDSMNSSQLEGKLWLGDEMKKLEIKPKKVALLGGWYAHYLTSILIDHLDAKFVINFEIDEDAHFISFKFNRRYKDAGKYRSMRKNVMFKAILSPQQPIPWSSDLGDDPYDVIVNTSCEHMFPMWKFREINYNLLDPLYVLQSTNQKEHCEDHINTVESEEELIDQARLLDVWYAGRKKLPNGFTRFMVIGK
jgi:hypothetical protein